MSTGAVTDEVWTGWRSNALPPSGWEAVESNVDPNVTAKLCPIGGPYGLPPLPDQFETWVTCNIINKNYTTVVHEVYDAPNNRALFTMYDGSGSSATSTMYLYDLGEYFTFNSSE